MTGENFEGIDGLCLTEGRIIGINFTTNAQHRDLFAGILKKIPNLQANLDRYEIYFCWMVTPNCNRKLFEPREHTVDGVTFRITREDFQKEVMQKHKKLVKAHKTRIDRIIGLHE